MNYTAVVLAGSRPGRDDFAASFGTDIKALIVLGGEPMLCRPVQALLASHRIDRILVLSQAPDRIAAALPSSDRLECRRSLGTIAETMLELCADPQVSWPLLVTTADHALLDPPMINQFADQAALAEVAVGVVEKVALLRRLPATKRTWLAFRGGSYTGANLFALGSPAVRPAIDLWRTVEQDRKKAWRVISLLGPWLLLRAALRLVTLDEVMGALGQRLGLSIRAIQLSDPLAGVDVDTSNDHALVEAILAGRQ